MSQRVVGTDRALQAVQEMRRLLAGDLGDRLRQLDQHGRRLGRPDVWEGPEAARFRQGLWPGASAMIGRVLAQLDRLARQAERINRDILAAGGRGGAQPAAHRARASAIPGGVPAPPPSSTPPADVHRWWEGLTPEQQAEEIRDRPGTIGSLDGVPAADRDRANRLELAREEEALEASGSDPGRLAGLRALDARLEDHDHADPDNPDHPRPYLLGLDQKGHVIVAIGNPDYADNVVTMVPGGTQLDNAPDQLSWAKSVVTASRKADPTQTTAAILWQDYDSPSSPNGLNAFNKPGPAEAAGKPLNDFQQGLRATHEQRPGGLALHMVLVGHSYGTVVVGDSSQQPDYQPPDDMIMTGSPGMGVDRLSSLHVPQPDGRSHLWAGVASGDTLAAVRVRLCRAGRGSRDAARRRGVRHRPWPPR
jgi:Alpha/beta hydrolase